MRKSVINIVSPQLFSRLNDFVFSEIGVADENLGGDRIMFQTLPGYQVSKQQNDVNDGNLKRLM
jgi:hypothetical protein